MIKSCLFFLVTFSTLACRTIYVYDDDGVGPESLQQAIHTFENLSPKCPVKTLNAIAVIAGNWTGDALLFIMPGGADIPYTKKLDGAGNAVIRDYVLAGGTYLGFCAGAYYGASFIEFDQGGPYQVIGKRELAFFPGTEIGPALKPYSYTNNSGATVSNLRLNNKQRLPGFVNGGGYFKNASSFSNVTILGWYPGKEERAAIVKIQIGKGFAVLSGVHLEYNPALMNKKDPFLALLIPMLVQANKKRLKWLVNLFQEASAGKARRCARYLVN